MQAGPCCGLSPPRPRLGRGFGWVLQHLAPPPARGTGKEGTGRVEGAEPHSLTPGNLLISNPL